MHTQTNSPSRQEFAEHDTIFVAVIACQCSYDGRRGRGPIHGADIVHADDGRHERDPIRINLRMDGLHEVKTFLVPVGAGAAWRDGWGPLGRPPSWEKRA